MAKRVVTKIGDVFSVTLDNGNLRFFQYIANDLSCLNSSVIRVFKKEYPKEYVLKPEEVVSDNIDFYSHTILKFDISDGAWQKVGNCQNVGDTENILFRMYLSDAASHKDRIWYAWYINKERFTIGKLSKDIRVKSDIGLVFPYDDIVMSIKEGKMRGTMFEVEEY